MFSAAVACIESSAADLPIAPASLDLKCCTSKQYREWLTAARSAPPDPKIGFCEDCTPDYQASMRKDGRCVRPKIMFFREVATTFRQRDVAALRDHDPDAPSPFAALVKALSKAGDEQRAALEAKLARAEAMKVEAAAAQSAKEKTAAAAAARKVAEASKTRAANATAAKLERAANAATAKAAKAKATLKALDGAKKNEAEKDCVVVGYFNEAGKGAVYGAYAASSYHFVDIKSGVEVLAVDERIG
jgi:hypothetical protein